MRLQGRFAIAQGRFFASLVWRALVFLLDQNARKFGSGSSRELLLDLAPRYRDGR